MSTNPENWEEMGLSAALAGNYARDSKGFLESLASTLSTVIPDQIKVERKKGLFVKEHPITKLELYFGDMTYGLEVPDHGPMRAWRSKTVRGICLKTDDMPVEEWIMELAAEMETLKGVAERTFFAMKEFLR